MGGTYGVCKREVKDVGVRNGVQERLWKRGIEALRKNKPCCIPKISTSFPFKEKKMM